MKDRQRRNKTYITDFFEEERHYKITEKKGR